MRSGFMSTGRHDTSDGFVLSGTITGVAIDSLGAGTTLVVNTRNSKYRFVLLFEPSVVLVKGGAIFPEATVVRFDGATAGDSPLKVGWILVGFQMEMRVGSVRIRSSRVHSVSIESLPTM
jgi:hypothetical protein